MYIYIHNICRLVNSFTYTILYIQPIDTIPFYIANAYIYTHTHIYIYIHYIHPYFPRLSSPGGPCFPWTSQRHRGGSRGGHHLHLHHGELAQPCPQCCWNGKLRVNPRNMWLVYQEKIFGMFLGFTKIFPIFVCFWRVLKVWGMFLRIGGLQSEVFFSVICGPNMW